MARLRAGQREQRQNSVFRLLGRSIFGIKESEVAEELGVNRRTANTYLRELEKAGKAEKSGWFWYRKK